MKLCPRCQQLKDESDFGPNRARKDGLQTQCRVCKKEIQNRWYRKNQKTHYANVKQRRKEVVDFVAANVFEYLKTHPCVDCGESDPVVLDFDHVRGKKNFTIGSRIALGYCWATILAEIEKCEVRCANCHRRRTAERHGHRRAILMGWILEANPDTDANE